MAPAKKPAAGADRLRPHFDPTPAFWLKVQVMRVYIVWVIKGLILEVVERLAHQLHVVPGKAPSDERHLPIFDGMRGLFMRFCYGPNSDCWNRPINSEAGTWIDVMDREAVGPPVIKERADSSGTFAPNGFRTTGGSKRALNLGSYNYLGFGGVNTYCTPLVAQSALDEGVGGCLPAAVGGGGSALVDVERAVAKYVGKEAALVMSMGFGTNSSSIPALLSPGALLLSDSLNHCSIIEGARSCQGVKVQVFKHNDMHDLDKRLHRAMAAGRGKMGQPYVPWTQVIIVVEGIYSMEGEFCRLPAVVDVKKRYPGVMLYLDEAHSIGACGATGRGVTEYLGVDTNDVDVMMGTFTKSFGGIGGYVAANRDVIDRLRPAALSSNYGASMPAPVCRQIISALRVVAGEDGTDIGKRKLEALARNSRLFRQGLEAEGLVVLGDLDSPVVPLMVYCPNKMCLFSRAMLAKGVAVVCVGFPATPLLLARIRFCLSAGHTEAEIKDAVAKIAIVAQAVGLPKKLPSTFQSGGSVAHSAPASNPDALPAHARAPLWKPLPLASGVVCSHLEPDPEVDGEPSNRRSGVNMWSWDYLRLSQSQMLRQKAADAINKYGCGSCGPRGFYGTVDVHLELEQRIASWLKVPACITYSYGMCTVSSVIPALARPLDLVVVDEKVSFMVQRALKLSKALLRTYKHNDMDSLELVLREVETEDGGLASSTLRAPSRRRFLVTEALFTDYGTICNLPKLLELKKRYCFRLVLDESHSIGALGATGRGVTEHFGVPAADVDVICGSCENVFGSVGGFCAGQTQEVEHQRLFGSGYVFSASQTPFSSVVSKGAIDLLDSQQGTVLMSTLNTRRRMLATHLASAMAECPALALQGDTASPVMHLRLRHPPREAEREAEMVTLLARMLSTPQTEATHHIVDVKAVLPPARTMFLLSPPRPSIRLVASVALTEDATQALCNALKEAHRMLEGTLDPAAHLSRIAPGSPPRSPMMTPLRSRSQPAPMVDDFHLTESKTDDMSMPQGLRRCPSFPDLAAVPPRTSDMRGPTDTLTFPALLVAELGGSWLRSRTAPIRAELHERVLPIVSKFKSPLFDGIFALVSVLSSEKAYVFHIPMFYWFAPLSMSLPAFTLFSLSNYTGGLLKNTLRFPRPSSQLAAGVNPVALDNSDFAFPSIMAVHAASIPYLVIQMQLRAMGMEHLWPLGTLVSLITTLSMCMSRVYLGADTVVDVIGGTLIGSFLARMFEGRAETAIFHAVMHLDFFDIGWIWVAFICFMAVHPIPAETSPAANSAFSLQTRTFGFLSGLMVARHMCALSCNATVCHPWREPTGLGGEFLEADLLGWALPSPFLVMFVLGVGLGGMLVGHWLVGKLCDAAAVYFLNAVSNYFLADSTDDQAFRLRAHVRSGVAGQKKFLQYFGMGLHVALIGPLTFVALRLA